MEKKREFNYIDLFAGCGGLSLGLHMANWKGLFAIERNESAFKTLEHNLILKKKHFQWPGWLEKRNHNIDEVLKNNSTGLKQLNGKVTLVAGGPPCQGFSTAGKRDEKDERNKLANSYLEFVNIVKPGIILFENVKGFRSGFKNKSGKRGQPYSRIVLERLKEIGYHDAEDQIVDFSGFGIPQMRKRFIMIGTLFGNASRFFKLLHEIKEEFLTAKGVGPLTTLEEAISDIERIHGEVNSPDSPGFMAGIYSKNPLSNYQQLMRQYWRQDIPDSHRFVNHSEKIKGKFRDIISNRLSNPAIRDKYNSKKTSTLLLDAKKPCYTLTTLPDDYVHYSEPRILTVREYARIQSFPDWFEFKGEYTTGTKRRRFSVPRYSQVGNAIPPLFAELCGMVLKHLVEDDTRR